MPHFDELRPTLTILHCSFAKALSCIFVMQDISTFNPFAKPVRVITHPEQYRAAGIDIWRSCYDAELPANLLEMCHPDKCDLCGVPFSKPIVAKTHYVGKIHCQKTAKFLGTRIQ